MGQFEVYAAFYDLLYQKKDYAGEAAYTDGLIRRYSRDVKTLLDLGCGTGRHDECLASLGYDVLGVDLSEGMLRQARSKKSSLAEAVASRLSYRNGDVRSLRLNQTFDAVISLFHVMSYQRDDEELRAAFVSARTHLADSGIFVFDYWYGPAVLADPPTRKVTEAADDNVRVVRIAEPTLHLEKALVDVHFHVTTTELATGVIHETEETHTMHFLFNDGIDAALHAAGLKALEHREWMTGKQLHRGSWSACCVARPL